MKTSRHLAPELPTSKMRLIAIGLALMSLSGLACVTYFFDNLLLPIYEGIFLSTPLIETPYMVFGILMAPPILTFLLLASGICIWTGRKFDPPRCSWLYRFQVLACWLTVQIAIYIVPAAAILTTLALMATGYSTCSELRTSSSNWQVFWVNDPRFCFKPDFFNSENRPCKKVNGRDTCMQADGKDGPPSLDHI